MLHDDDDADDNDAEGAMPTTSMPLAWRTRDNIAKSAALAHHKDDML